MEKQDGTKAIRVKNKKTQYNEHSTPIFLTSSFTFECAEDMRAAFADEVETTVYSRFVNPNYCELVDKMCALEGTESGYPTASGMAAIFASMVAEVMMIFKSSRCSLSRLSMPKRISIFSERSCASSIMIQEYSLSSGSF